MVNIELHSVNEQFYAQIERYDRVLGSGTKIQRLHQEDFCQALGYGYEKKYQDAGGPSFSDCYRLLQDVSTDPAIDSQYLLRWQIFNVLAGNSDGHAKNLSLLYLEDGGIRLAPFYDLVCTRAIERIDYHLALEVGGQRDPTQITTEHWNKLAKECDVNSRFLQLQLKEVATTLLHKFSDTKTIFNNKYGDYPALQRIEHIVTQQCRHQLDNH